ncbi:dephospho-CoA kinase [Saccharopolyspora dendranthemae]|uniref:Dephospho-CoA kinase n=1 Tax=Saccharopolyspora dendranthemae TaxID=1181886 RepID=A0A561U399_9PSEU|nr:dephospho-CoA kinase [Saccharopolyspora dendranthemae]TWF93827.1 dephospho-CoA kinase [Saccharopolyspora dendranthemae]
MLRVGLTGGIGSGKSTVARRLAELGAVVIDADQLSREAVEPGSAGLAELIERFGEDVLDSSGALDRPALAAKAFADEQSRLDLNAIVHPRVAELTARRMAEAPADSVLVHDIPLLVEAGYAPNYHLVLIVDAAEDVRVQRLVGRGLAEQDARARIAAQATEEQRREVADVWLDNGGEVEDLLARVDELWKERLVPFERNLRLHQRNAQKPPTLVDPDPEWAAQARRLIARVERAAGQRAVRVDHVGSTSVPIPAKDVIDLQLTVRTLADADALAEPLDEAGFPLLQGLDSDPAHDFAPEPEQWSKRIHAAADPGRYVNLHIRVEGTAAWRVALLFPAWLRADPQAREDYLATKRQVAEAHADDPDHQGYAEAKEPWFIANLPRAMTWADATHWTP